MTLATRPLSLSQVLDEVLTRRLADVHTAMPARVERFDAAKQVVDCAPLLQARVETEDGFEDVSLPVVPNVPVVFPGAGGFRITFPVKPGDVVLLVFSESSIDRWQALDGVQPDEGRRHHLADAIAIPGLHSDKRPWNGVSTSGATIGHDTGPGIVMLANEIHLGSRDGQLATEPVLLGETTTAGFDALLTDLLAQLAAAITALGTAATGLTTAATTNAIPIVGGIIALPSFTIVVAQLAALAATLGQMVASVTTLKAKLALMKSGIVKTR